MTTEEKFNAAVNVIRNLPKNGAYQPSNEILLRFYSYYKQATEGPCQQQKPAFWEVIKKAKWDAWMRLGNMSRSEAMNNYVEELKKIVETMSYTDNVATFLGSLDSFYESVPAEDLELLVGPVLERMRSQPSSPLSQSPLGSRETSPQRVRNASRRITSSLETSPASSHSASPLLPDTDGEEDEFIDTVESAPERAQKDVSKTCANAQNGLHDGSKEKSTVVDRSKVDDIERTERTERTERLSQSRCANSNGQLEAVQPDGKRQRNSQRMKKNDKDNTEFFNRIAMTMQNMQRDLDGITARVRSLEGQSLKAVTPQLKHVAGYARPKWWPFPECSPRMFAIFIMWPFLAQALVTVLQRYRRRKL